MSTIVLGSYSFANTPDVNGNLLLISGSAINSSPIGNATPSTGAFTTLTATSLNNTVIGNTTPSTGQFTYAGVGTAPTTAAFVEIGAGTTTTAPINLSTGANMTTPTAGSIEYDGVSMYKVIDTTNGRSTIDGWNYFRLSGAGSGISTIADFFGTNDGIPLVAGGLYEVEWHCCFAQTVSSGTATWTIVSTNALQSLMGGYSGSPIAGIGTVGSPQVGGVAVTTSTSTAFPVTGTEATGATHCFIIGVILQANATTGGNTRLRLTMSAGTATPQTHSYFRVRRLPATNTGTFVA
jgi:hypothetical protein